MSNCFRRTLIIVIGTCCVLVHSAQAQPREARFDVKHRSPVQPNARLHILRAEDRRTIDEQLLNLLNDSEAQTRRRAAVALGRIGDASAVGALAALLEREPDAQVRVAAVFGLGEIEAAEGIAPLRRTLRRAEEATPVRARAVEALGKIAAALSAERQAAERRDIENELTKVLDAEAAREKIADREIALAAITAALRARLTDAGPTIARFLHSGDARVRADAANTLARLRLKTATAELESLLADEDATVRANAARALGAAESHSATERLGNLLGKEADERVRVSAIRALGAIKDSSVTEKILAHARPLLMRYQRQRARGVAHPPEINELLEVAAALALLANQSNETQTLQLIKELRASERQTAPELEIAYARIAAPEYARAIAGAFTARKYSDWRVVSAVAQGLGELAQVKTTEVTKSSATRTLRSLLDDRAAPALAMPDVLRAFAAFKTVDAGDVFARHLRASDVMVRATAAELLGALPPSAKHAQLLGAALPPALKDALNDAALAILDALGKQPGIESTQQAMQTALRSPDHLVRRRAAQALRGSNNYSPMSVGAVESNYTTIDYQRALRRAARAVTARVSTDKGVFSVELLPNEAPLTVDSFVRLARRGFFNNLTFHRVVPNFVIQGGDPRGDGNGGPNYQIRCEINEVPYDRGAVGMALSGKDTGGSQWFVTHAPQPHLDGGYTVFGRVTQGMSVVDAIARGDRIRRVVIVEKSDK